MTALLFYGDTERSPAMRHELPVTIGDPFLLGVVDGRLHVMASGLERARIEAAAPDAVLHDYDELGFRELLESGMSRHELELELASRAAAAMGIRAATADPDMPVAVADRLRADGVVLHLDDDAISARRRVKSAPELAGTRRAQIAAEAGMSAAAGLLRRSDRDGDRLKLDGEVLTAEAVRAAVRDVCQAHGAPAPPDIIVSSPWSGYGHDPGSGPLPADLPIVIDLWPRDETSGCWADMTRTFVVGEISEQVRSMESLVLEAFERARDAVAPGITGRALHDLVCDVFEPAGYRTQRNGPGEDPNEGFQFSLGHGVGLAVHEPPGLGRTGHDALVAGDVIAIEPGLWVREVGEVRFEDLLLVTEDGCETLTQVPVRPQPLVPHEHQYAQRRARTHPGGARPGGGVGRRRGRRLPIGRKGGCDRLDGGRRSRPGSTAWCSDTSFQGTRPSFFPAVLDSSTSSRSGTGWQILQAGSTPHTAHWWLPTRPERASRCSYRRRIRGRSGSSKSSGVGWVGGGSTETRNCEIFGSSSGSGLVGAAVRLALASSS